MKYQKFKPKLDKLFWTIAIPTEILVFGITLITAISHWKTLFLMLPITLFITYFLISPLFGYVELREDTVFIKYGFFLKKEIRYDKIRGIEKERKFYSDSMMSLKNAFEHVNIKYNSFDVTTISVVENDIFIEELNALRNKN